MNINVGIYRDDGLIAVRLTNRQSENLKKQICQIFQQYDLKITIEANKKVVDFLDVTLDLQREEFRPFIKQNNKPKYVHAKSNHPLNVLKNVM